MIRIYAALGAVGILIGAYLYWSHLTNKIERLESEITTVTLQRDEAVRVANANAASIEIIKAAAAWDMHVLSDRAAKAEKRKPIIRTIYREIDSATDAENGPIAIVLSRALERLRSLQITIGDGGEGAESHGAIRAFGLLARSGNTDSGEPARCGPLHSGPMGGWSGLPRCGGGAQEMVGEAIAITPMFSDEIAT